MLVFQLLRDCRSHNLDLNFAQSDTLTLSSYKNIAMLRMILISFIHITNKKRKITRKYGQSCYTKYNVHQCNGNIGITFCTRDRVTKFYIIFLRFSKKYVAEIENECFLQIGYNCYLWSTVTYNKLRCLTLRTFLSTLHHTLYKIKWSDFPNALKFIQAARTG